MIIRPNKVGDHLGSSSFWESIRLIIALYRDSSRLNGFHPGLAKTNEIYLLEPKRSTKVTTTMEQR